MNAGKAIYYLLSNASSVTDICGTRIYPELAEQEAPTPFVVYEIISVDPDDTNDGPAKMDEVSIDITAVADSYDTCADLASAIRSAIDRVRGTYNGVNVDSIQYSTTDTDVFDSPRRYAMTAGFIIRISRDDAQIATGQPIDLLTILRLADTPSAYGTTGQVLAMNAAGDAVEWTDAGGAINELNDVGDVNAPEPLDRQALAFDEATGEWIADGVGQVVIPIRNNSPSQTLNKGIIVAFAGTQGDRILVEPWDNASPSAYIVGVLSESLAGGADGHAQTYGEIRALDTSAYALDAILYASGSGTFTTTANSLPVATVTRVHQNTGRIFVRLYVPGDHYRDRFRAEAVAAATAHSVAPAGMETYYTAQANGDGFHQSPGDDTARTEGDVVRRIIYWKAGAFAAINSGGFTEVTLDDDSTYAELLAAIDDILNANGAPITIYSTRQEVTPLSGLLQEYPGAEAAYSLRLLDGDYAGAAIRVRRSGDNSEQDIGFDSGGEVDRDAIANFCSPGDGFVKVWYDQSGNANHATQTTTSNQPKIYDASTGVVMENGKPAVQMANNTIKLSVPNSKATFKFLHDGSSSSTSWVVSPTDARETSGTTQHELFETGEFSGSVGLEILYTSSQYSGTETAQFLVKNGTTTSVNYTTPAGTFAIGQNLASFYIDADNATADDRLKVAVNGGSLLSGNTQTAVPSTADSQSDFTIYGGFTAHWQEVIVWNSDQSANRAGIETNINDHYTIY